MSNLEQVKERLKGALNKINTKLIDAQNSIQKQHKLEVENNELRASVILLKKEISELKNKVRSISIEAEQKSLGKQVEIKIDDEDINLKTEEVESKPNDSTISLNELKDLVGNKKWG